VTWNNKPGSGAREVIDAFLEKRPKRRGDFESDGTAYAVRGYKIAKHVEVSVPEAVAHKLMHNRELVRIAFRFSGTRSVSNHLNLFKGVFASLLSDGTKMINGKVVDDSAWYTLEEIDALPAYKATKPSRPGLERFVNLTAPLFA
jgi:hypothetical protein